MTEPDDDIDRLMAIMQAAFDPAYGEAWTRRQVEDALLLEMRRGNPAEILYTNHGFLPIGERPRYYRTPGGNRLDAVTFCREMK